MTRTDAFPPAPALHATAFLLDFDGTLVEIAPTPDAVIVPPGLPALLSRLHAAAEGAVALVSGRALSELETFLPSFPGPMVGSHGAERRGHPPTAAPASLPDLHAALRAEGASAGFLVEIKALGGGLHYRHDPARAGEAEALAQALAAAHPGFAVQRAKMAFELKPAGATKDAAVARLMAEAPFGGRRPVYLGDDTTDEPAIAWVQARGGLGLKVGEGESAAAARLDGPSAVHAWLAAALEGA